MTIDISSVGAGQTTKVCKGCGQRKTKDQFKRTKQNRDGLSGKCKGCCREMDDKWRRANPEKVAAKTKRYTARHPERVAARKKRWWSQNPDLKESYNREYRARYPEKARAHDAIRNGVHEGRIVKPGACDDCHRIIPDPADLHAHHHDYSQPLDVEWLCRDCHSARHVDEEAP